MLPWLAVGFVPVALGLPWLYAWAGPAPGELVREQAAYFNLPWFLARAAAYFAAWIGLAAWMKHASDEQTRTRLEKYMPEVRSRILMVLSSQSPIGVQTQQGKTDMANAIKQAVNQPFSPLPDGQYVTDVLFTAFVVQ